MGGGSIIIHQAEVIRDALLHPAFSGNPDQDWQATAAALCLKALDQWTATDCIMGAVLLARCIQ